MVDRLVKEAFLVEVQTIAAADQEAVGAGNARRLCHLDTDLLQCPNSPGTEELPR
jgi:hypothetical protein